MRRNFWRELVNIAALGGWVQKHIFYEDGNFVLLLRYGSDGEPFFGASERDVKEAPLFLNVKLFGGLAFLHERGGKFECARPFGGGEFFVVHAQQENVRKFEALRGVYGHQADRVAGHIVLEADIAASLRIVVEVFDELDEGTRLTFWFPRFGEFGEASDIFTVLLAGPLRDFEPFEKVGENFTCGTAL